MAEDRQQPGAQDIGRRPKRCFNRGGNYNNTNNGFPSFNGNNARSNANTNIGFRSAYPSSQMP